MRDLTLMKANVLPSFETMIGLSILEKNYPKKMLFAQRSVSSCSTGSNCGLIF